MNQILQSSHPYPQERAFIIKLHREADLAAGDLRGRMVHLTSDQRAEFEDAAGLLRCLQALIGTCIVSETKADACGQ